MTASRRDLQKQNKELTVENADLRAKLKLSKSVVITQLITKTISTLGRYGMFIAIAYFASEAIGNLAGKTTNSSIALNVLGDFKADRWFAYLFGIGGMWYGKKQKKMKHTTTKKMHPRIKFLEEHFDKDRTSSDLNTVGEPDSEDQE